MRDDDIVERRLDNGWYELSTLVASMGEEYRVHKRYDHQPTDDDYASFMSYAEATRQGIDMTYTFETDSLTDSIPIRDTQKLKEFEKKCEQMIKQLTNN